MMDNLPQATADQTRMSAVVQNSIWKQQNLKQ